MKITVIAAVAADGAIGRNGDLLWHLPADLKHFKALTTGCPVVMGRNTWESLPKRPLPGRLNIVVSSSPDYVAEGAVVAHSLSDAVRLGREEVGAMNKELFIIGGGKVYAEAINMADALELTEIDATCPDADTHFPRFDRGEWELVSSELVEEKGMAYRFNRYERKISSDVKPGNVNL